MLTTSILQFLIIYGIVSLVSGSIDTQTNKPRTSSRKLLSGQDAVIAPTVFRFDKQSTGLIKKWDRRLGVFCDGYLYWGDADTFVSNAVENYKGTLLLGPEDLNVVVRNNGLSFAQVRQVKKGSSDLSWRRNFQLNNIEILYGDEQGGPEGLVRLMNNRKDIQVPGELFLDEQTRAKQFKKYFKAAVVAEVRMNNGRYPEIRFDAELLEPHHSNRQFVFRLWGEDGNSPTLQILPDIVLYFSNVVSVTRNMHGILLTATIPGYTPSLLLPKHLGQHIVRFKNICNSNWMEDDIFLLMAHAAAVPEQSLPVRSQPAQKSLDASSISRQRLDRYDTIVLPVPDMSQRSQAPLHTSTVTGPPLHALDLP